jgi:RimJ/RimL family protein N-acetyltransferase
MNVEDSEQFTEWMNDLDVTSNLGVGSNPVSLVTQRKKLEEFAEGHQYAIVELETDKLIGSCGLDNIHEVHRCATVRIMIGDKSYHNKGYGRKALRLLLDFAFNYLNVHNVTLWVYEDNAKGIACYKSVGFKEAGRRRQANRINGKWRDILIMDLLPGELIMGSDH